MAAKKTTTKKAVSAPKIKVPEVSLEQLLEAGAHYGHMVKRWNPKMEEYIYDTIDGVHVFDLIKTKAAIEEALGVIAEAKKAGKIVLLVGTKKQAKDAVRAAGEASGAPYVDVRWLGGTFTNFNQVRNSVQQIDSLREGLESGEFRNRTKKERLMISRKIEKLEGSVGGIKTMSALPDLLVIVDTHKEQAALREAKAKKIPVIGIVDTNADPSLVDYVVPMNDDSVHSIEYFMNLVAEVLKS